jgi:hypothetical protein
LVVLTSTAAHAAMLASGPVFGGNSQDSAHCYAFNTSSTATRIISAAIRDQSGAVVSGTNNCNGVILNQFQTCNIDVGPLSIQTYECNFQTGSTDASSRLRGELDIRDANGNVLVNSELR